MSFNFHSQFLDQKKFQAYFLLLLLATYTLFFWLPLGDLNYFNFDSALIVDPLLKVSSFADYWSLKYNLVLLDLAPVSDLSHLIDIRVQPYLGFNFSVFQNVLLFELIVLQLFFFIKAKYTRTSIAWLTITLLLFHPLALQSVLWISARKHLLAAMFGLAAIVRFEKFESEYNFRSAALAFVFYALSILSWPILILIPIPVFLRMKIERGNFFKMLPFFILMIFGLVANMYYYSFIFPRFVGGSKFLNNDFSLMPLLLGIGRAIFQICLPYKFALSYSAGSEFNLYGLLLSPIFFYIFFKLNSRKEFLYSTFLWVAPLLIVLVKPTVIFAMDTYFFFPLLVSFTFLVPGVIEKILNVHRPIASLIYLLVLISFFSISINQVNVFYNNEKLIERSIDEKNCLNLGAITQSQWNKGKVLESINHYKSFLRMGCRKSNFQQIHIYTVMLSEQHTVDEKRKILLEDFASSSLARIFSFVLDFDKNPIESVYKVQEFLSSDNVQQITLPTKLLNDPVLSKVVIYCENLNNDNCQNLMRLFRKKLIEK